jgi:hypothetical protein
MRVVLWLTISLAVFAQDEAELLKVKRVYVERLHGGDTAQHFREMLISALQAAKLFVITENAERADTTLKGASEDLVYTETFFSSEGIHARTQIGGTRSTGTTRGASGISVGEQESTRIAERKHEAAASVRLVNKDGDVIWSTTQESQGAKFRGASADVAAKITKQLLDDFARARKLTASKSAPASAAP